MAADYAVIMREAGIAPPVAPMASFDIEEGKFVIWRPRRERVHMNRALHGIATVVDCFMDDNDWLICLITKSTP